MQTGLRYWLGASSHLDVIALLLREIELVVVSMDISKWAEFEDEHNCARFNMVVQKLRFGRSKTGKDR